MDTSSPLSYARSIHDPLSYTSPRAATAVRRTLCSRLCIRLSSHLRPMQDVIEARRRSIHSTPRRRPPTSCPLRERFGDVEKPPNWRLHYPPPRKPDNHMKDHRVDTSEWLDYKSRFLRWALGEAIAQHPDMRLPASLVTLPGWAQNMQVPWAHSFLSCYYRIPGLAPVADTTTYIQIRAYDKQKTGRFTHELHFTPPPGWPSAKTVLPGVKHCSLRSTDMLWYYLRRLSEHFVHGATTASHCKPFVCRR